mmetsp:Transcript_24892/g.43756  ORF Transcript_24892/g.43756 Transcript_24892/m.43756 type:complete len:121 (+) Transcript_24892:150-512(+)
MAKRYYRQLRDIYTNYQHRGLEILAFPCNQFFKQEAWSEERILTHVRGMGVAFPIFAKCNVNGPNASNLYRFLRAHSELKGRRVQWNFCKFLIDREGNIVKFFGTSIEPERTRRAIESLL